MASAVARREAAVEAAVAPQGIAASRLPPAEREWHMLALPAVLEDGFRVGAGEYAAIEPGLLTLDPRAQRDADPEFTAILKMKREPLVLSQAEAETYASLRQRRARPVGQPLPLE